MSKNKKGMSAALTLVITAVVLIVISLVVITIVSGGLGNFFKRTDKQSNESSSASQCSAAVSYCNLQISSNCVQGNGLQGANIRYSGMACSAGATAGTGTWAEKCGGISLSC